MQGRWLVTDVAVRCGSDEHVTIQTVAWVAILLYPVGLLVTYSALLFFARRQIITRHPSTLSDALRFLHYDYKPSVFWWELMEMARRFVLVGLMVVVMPGTLVQLIIALVLAILYLVIQVRWTPTYTTPDSGSL